MDEQLLLSPIRFNEIERRIGISVELSVRRTFLELFPQLQPEPKEGDIDFAVSVIKSMSKSKVYKLSSEGALPKHHRHGRLWFYRSELEQWIADGMPHYGEQQAAKLISQNIK